MQNGCPAVRHGDEAVPEDDLFAGVAGSQVGSAKSCTKTASGWSPIPVASYTTLSNGGTLRYEVTQDR